jgi:outer membrane receptor protein involved in Fe transport
VESGPLNETQRPNLFAGYHREWSPGIHTLFLGARLDDTLTFRQPNTFIRTLVRDSGGALTGEVDPAFSGFDVDYKSDFNAWSAELQQIMQQSVHTLVMGGRYQRGETDTKATVRRDPFAFPPVFTDPASVQDFETDLERASAYAYYHLRLFEPLLLTGGVSYDHLRYPRNADLPPLRPDETTRDQVSPKAGIVWTPTAATSIRGAYTRSLGGVFYDSSVRLEPTQVAGFIQSYRSLIPESVIGSVPGSRFETFHIGVEQKFATETYLVLQGEWLRSKGSRSVGVFDYTDAPPFLAEPSTTPQRLEFEEKSLVIALNQLVGNEWVFGARYRISHAELENEFTALSIKSDEEDTLHQVNLFAIWQNAAGFFSRGEALWYSDFWQFNALVGYRFPKRRAEIAVGILNLADQDYRLDPLNAIVELPHERTFIASLKFNF